MDFVKAGFLVIAELDIELLECRHGLLSIRLSKNDVFSFRMGYIGRRSNMPVELLLLNELGAKITRVYRFAAHSRASISLEIS